MNYRLSATDRLLLIANHHQSSVQLVLHTQDTGLLRRLPSNQTPSLVTRVINNLRHYLLRVSSYPHPLTAAQNEKKRLVLQAINELNPLLRQERHIAANSYSKQEQLRQKVMHIITQCADNNRLLANNPLVSEGALGQFFIILLIP